MGIFSRLSTLFKSNINSAISKAEDPEKVLNQLILDMREQLITAKKQVAVAIADEKRLAKQFQDAADQANEWERKAMTAVNAGRDDLAMEALQRQKQSAELAQEFQKQHALQKAATEKLRASLRQLNDKIEEARRKKDLLIARQRRAEAQTQIHDTLSGMGDNSAFDTFDRMAEKVDRMEAEADASAELASDMADTNLDEKFRDLERTAGTSDALEALKARMGKAADAQPAATAAQATTEASEFDFEELEAELASMRVEDGNKNGNGHGF